MPKSTQLIGWNIGVMKTPTPAEGIVKILFLEDPETNETITFAMTQNVVNSLISGLGGQRSGGVHVPSATEKEALKL